MGVIVFTNPVNLKYKTVICSKATAFYILCCLLTIIPPLLVAYRSEGNYLNSIKSHVLKTKANKLNAEIDPWLICPCFTILGFWKKIDVYREQPDVHYEYELVLLLETDSGNLGWSTYHGYNELMQERARVPTLKVKYRECRCKCLLI